MLNIHYKIEPLLTMVKHNKQGLTFLSDGLTVGMFAAWNIKLILIVHEIQLILSKKVIQKHSQVSESYSRMQGSGYSNFVLWNVIHKTYESRTDTGFFLLAILYLNGM